MVLPLDLKQGPIILPVRVSGPTTEYVLRFILDTGATTSMLNRDTAMLLGYDPADGLFSMQITTASGIELVSTIILERLAVLGQERANFPILCHTLPAEAGVDGVLGLDFFRGRRLTLDFRVGLVMLD